MRSLKTYGLACCVVGVCSTVASAAEFSLVPVSASGAHSISGNQIILDGVGQRVFLELKLSGWSPELLKTWQASIDSSGYSSGLQGVIAPAIVDCSADPNVCAAQLGAASACPAFPPFNCAAGFIDSSRADYVFTVDQGPCDLGTNRCVGDDSIPCLSDAHCFETLSELKTVDLSTLDFRYGSTLFVDSVTDPGTPRYTASLVVDVPVGAMGTFTVGFLAGDNTFIWNPDFQSILPLTLTPALITISCQDDLDCDDDNECTNDDCQADGTCVNADNYDDTVDCCNPADGALTPIDDGNECTNDICEPDGSVTHPPRTGEPCGDPTINDCTDRDTCDGAGICQENDKLADTPCGDPTEDDCTDPDVCDGAGTCLPKHVMAGTLCGDPDDDECTDPDTCDGAGTCQANNAPDGTLCQDGLFCTEGETCTAGDCGGGTDTDCDDAIPCTDDSCDDINDTCVHALTTDVCLIASTCRATGEFNPNNECEECNPVISTTDWSFRSPGSECDDGDPCTGTGREGIDPDTCDGAGTCAGELDLECNDQCEFAVEVFEGVNTGNNQNGGPDDVEASCQADSNNDVWFIYTATCTGTAFTSTTGSVFTPANDSVLSVYDACPDQGGTEIACDDDSGVDLHAALIFPTVAETTYWLRVAGFEDSAGDIVLHIEPFDDCLIDGVCYPAEGLNPENDCEACIPEVSTTSWSPLHEGSVCGDPSDTDCDSPDACDGAGLCEQNFKPEGSACGDQSDTECDNPDTCNAVGTCLPNYEVPGAPCGSPDDPQCDNPDICDGAGLCIPNFEEDGTPCNDEDICTEDDMCDTGLCVGTPIPQAPIVVSEGPRYIDVTPQPPGSVAPVALMVTSPDWTCLSKYIDADGTLVADPVIQLPDAWGTVIVQGPDFVPSSTYNVVAKCSAHVSAPGSASTSKWGDVAGSFTDGQWPPPDGSVGLADFLAIIEGFQHVVTAPALERIDLWPCMPDGSIDLRELTMVISAFQGLSYEESTGCPAPCP